MYKIPVSGHKDKPPLIYTYLVGTHSVGIITPSRKRYLFLIHEVSGRPEGHRLPGNDGSSDSRLHPDEVAAFVLKRGLK
jgi:hypothetical protein